MYKYIVLDFGKVLAYSPSNDWNITPKFFELIDINKIDMDKFNELIEKNRHILNEVILTLDEEYEMFIRFYDNILRNLDYPDYNIEISKQLAFYRTYNMDRFKLYDNVMKELTELKMKYKLIMVTDNWPCIIPYLKYYNLYDFFDKIYISSLYGYLKRDLVLFDYPNNDYNIKEGEALFIDDIEENLDAAKLKGFDVMLMDRTNSIKDSKYKIINNLYDI